MLKFSGSKFGETAVLYYILLNNNSSYVIDKCNTTHNDSAVGRVQLSTVNISSLYLEDGVVRDILQLPREGCWHEIKELKSDEMPPMPGG